MSITIDDVRHVARLARLQMDDDAAQTMTDELASILGHIGRIGELDLEGVKETTHVIDVTNVWGEDVPHESISHDDALKNAPDETDSQFGVPRMGS